MKNLIAPLAVVALATASQAQATRPGFKVVPVPGTIHRSTLDLDNGKLTHLPVAPAGTSTQAFSFVCYDNTTDIDPNVTGSFLDALLYPPGVELMDWGIKNCGGSDLIESFTFGYASTAEQVVGASLTLRVYEGSQGFGTFGTEVANFTFTNLPSDGPDSFTLLIPRMITVDLGTQAFFLPDGPFGYSLENADGVTAPLLVDVTIANGTQNFFDVYEPAGASASNYDGTYSVLPGGLSDDPFENSFWFQLGQNNTLSSAAVIDAAPNPFALGTPLSPITGSVWTANVFAPPTEPLTFLILSATRVFGVATPFGELVVDYSTQIGKTTIKLGPAHNFPIPLDPSFLGVEFFAQGAYSDLMLGNLQFTNALELTIGAF